jgi:predicted flap endonuclease-1-like 5' DNA nuclease
VLLATVGFGAWESAGPAFSPVVEVAHSTDSSHDLVAIENRLTAIEYGLTALHHILRSRVDLPVQRTESEDVSAGRPLRQIEQREPQPAPERPEREADPINAFRRAGDEANLLSEPAFGSPDDLEAMDGVGPMLRALLYDIGVFYFWQVAEWTDQEIDWVESKLMHFRGRIRRDDWVGQARILAQATTMAKRPSQLRAKRAAGL